MEKILTKHPQGKKGLNIAKEKYNLTKKAILECLKNNNLTHAELTKCVGKKLKNFKGSIHWYVEIVKLDLEARKIIKRISDKKSELYWLN